MRRSGVPGSRLLKAGSQTGAVYCATKFAVRAISDGLRQETGKIRVTVVCPGVVESELANSISDETAREAMKGFRKVALGGGCDCAGAGVCD
ncbi:Short-chain dehydrogenase/reductase SDR [Pseudomonas syringae pv. spinaceae]|nr:Short-chain dehydrogenase/reductase SDR [Pseudomonas syringae pv. spinaceae]